MAINITENIQHSSGGKIVSVAQSQGSWQSLANKAAFNTFTSTNTYKQNLANGQFFYVLDESQLYKLTVAGVGPGATYTLASASFGESVGTSALNIFSGSIQTEVDTLTAATSSYLTSVPSGTVSGSTQITSVITNTYISASAAASGFGSGGGSLTDISALNIFTASIQTEVTTLTAATSSYLTSADTGSFILVSQTGSFLLVSQTSSMSVATASFISDTFISASAVRSGFGAGGSSTDISALNIFTASIQTEVTTLTAATSSYLTSVPSGTISGSTQIGALGYITSVPSGTLSGSAQVETIIDDTYISASAALSGFGAGGGSSTDISALNTFTGSIQTEVTTLTAATSSYLTSADTGSFLTSVPSGTVSGSTQITSVITNTYISASAAASGFGSGGSAGSGIFVQTGSVYSTTNNLQITGSLTLADGLLVFKEFTSAPIAVAGGIYYSASAFYFGTE